MTSPTPDLILVNPLGGTLRHYTRALRELCSDGLTVVELIEFDEPSASGGTRIQWLLDYARALRRARRAVRTARATGVDAPEVVVVWPVLGYLDAVIHALLLGIRSRTSLVMHDPEPLVHAVGYSRWARSLARVSLGSRRLIVHSDTARAVVDGHGFATRTVTLPLPFTPAMHTTPRETDITTPDTRPIVRVLGQHKRDRDIALMTTLARELGQELRFSVHGRGWPIIAGWEREDAFVSEQRMDDLIESSAAVLIPYRRFFQSAIAVRALESGTPVVGAADTSLADLYPAGTALLVDAHDQADAARWRDAISTAVQLDRDTVAHLAGDAQRSAARRWRTWLAAGRSHTARPTRRIAS